LAGLETGSNYYPQYMFNTAFKECWNGSNTGYGIQTSSPYIKRGTNENCGNISFCRSFGTKIGYAGMEDSYGTPPYSIDSIKKSHYELSNDGLPRFNNNTYDSITQWHTALQVGLEGSLINNYVKNKSMMFSDNPWIAWLFPLSGTWFQNTPTNTISTIQIRPCTGEEFNLLSHYPVFLGSKGVFYWLKSRIYGIEKDSSAGYGSFMGLQASDSISYIDGLPKDISQFDEPSMNLDFIDFNRDDPNYRWNRHFDYNSYVWDLMNINSNRVYIGLQTLRYEIKKLNDWADHNSDFLLKLKLISWYGHGHSNIKIGNYKLGYNDNKIDDFIDINSIRTRPLDREYNGEPLYEQGSANDSGFYDIMIHKQVDLDIDKGFTMAVINRRTDPLVYAYDSLLAYTYEEQTPDYPFEGFRFYSTHEIDTYCDGGGNVINPTTLPDYYNPDIYVLDGDLYKPASYWRNLYWQRQGSREIRFRFNYHLPGNDTAKVLFRIKELMDTTAYNSNWAWWRKEQWNNSIHDTVIRSDRELVLKMLPGSGRMFSVSIENTLPFFGELANSNQTKIIAYPAHQTSNQNYTGHDTALYYHVVYHHVDSNNRYNTFYNALFPSLNTFSSLLAFKLMKG
jgi:hypothetical protein